MSGSLSPTVAASPTATEVAVNLLATMASLSGVATDFNKGSQIRTQSEAIGAVIDTQGVSNQALVLQGLAYSAMSLFGITPSGAVPASGTVTFATSFPTTGAPAATQSVAIPAGTLMQTSGGVQFATIAAVTLPSGATSVDAPVQAAIGGTGGNVPALAISGFPLTPVGYPIFVQNSAPIVGGTNAETPSEALARFTAKTSTLGLSSPVAVANALIGFTASGTGETVRFSACFEPWLAAGSGAGSGTAGFTVYIDNGTGAASSGLVAQSTVYLTGNAASGQSGFRPAGVPFSVQAVQPVYADVTVSGNVIPGIIPVTTIIGAVTTEVQAYFAGLGFQVAAQQAQIAADTANAGLGLFQSLTVNLFYSGTGTPVPAVSGGPSSRIILNNLTVNVS